MEINESVYKIDGFWQSLVETDQFNLEVHLWFLYVKVWVSNDFLRGFSLAVTSNFCEFSRYTFNTLKLMSSSSAIAIDMKNLVIDEGPMWYCHCCSAKNNSLWICDNCQLKNEAKVN